MSTAEQKQAAYLISQSVCAMIKAMGMTAENQYRTQRGETIAYNDKSFFDLIEEYGIHHNGAMAIIESLG